MRKALFALVAALGLLLAFPVAAAADHAGEWIPYDAGDPAHASSIVDPTTVELAIEDPEEAPLGTSVEIADLDHTVDGDTDVTFEYEEISGAGCGDKQVRVFVSGEGVGSAKDNNSWDQNQPDGTQCGEGGEVTFTIENGGTIEAAGVVYGSGEQASGVVRVSNLEIGEHLVHFTNPPAPEPCEWDDELVADDPECVEPEPEPTDEPDPDPTETSEPTTEPTSEPSSEPTEDESTDEPESTTTDNTTPASTQETLPDTGVSPLLLVGGGLALVLVGGAAMLRSRRTE